MRIVGRISLTLLPSFIATYRCPGVLNSALHWIAYRRKNNTNTECFIMVFDLRDEVFGEIMLPQCLVNSWYLNLHVHVFGESSIAVIHQKYKKPDIWVMKEYGVVASWVMIGTVGKCWRGDSRVLGFRSNGDVFLQFYRGGVASQNIESKRLKNLIPTVKYSYSSFYSYMESLVLLDKGSDVRASGTSSPNEAKRV
ncbi:F-box protein At3g07870-like [Jatropha curcas]|uniref:F-box protein At3g07870-like n=1 Tax=Jatropha curcas TaxID=180498 RepID=UPI0018956B38|nr:F-box protein At3g07870-like [Jatropha curcas]